MKKIHWVKCMSPNCENEVKETTLYCLKCKKRDMESRIGYSTLNKARLMSPVNKIISGQLNLMQSWW